MDIARASIEKKVNTWVLVLICLFGGIIAFQGLGRLEDPEFTIKDAIVFTSYPGGTPREVEDEVTDRVETAIQQMPQLWYVESKSKPGMSEITVKIQKKYDGKALPQIWDELRRKVGDVQSSLPPGTKTSVVNDDFGDVYGVLYAITGDGYTYRDLKEFAKTLRKELLLVKGVAKVAIAGDQQEQIFVEISRDKLAQLGVSPQKIFDTLRAQNVVQPSGQVRVGDEYVRIQPTGTVDSIDVIRNILIATGTSDTLLRLSDVATVKRSFKEVPDHLIRFNGKPALTVALSFQSGTNVVEIGEAVDKRIAELASLTPVGIRLHPIYEQPKIVDESVRGFVLNLLSAVAIVIVVLLVFMGLRAGALIGAILFLTVLGTLLFMGIFAIDMQRISLGALIIAMGMLVDNAIVVTEGIMVRIQAGEDRIKAASAVVKQTQWPLLGATVVGILAFAAIGLSNDSTGEYVRTLFLVVMISLLLSWVLAITVTPYFCYLVFRPKKTKGGGSPYDAPLFRAYAAFLGKSLKLRWPTVGVLVGMLGLAIVGFGLVKQSFFPDSTTPLFYVDYWRPQGTDIRATSRDMAKIEKHLMKIDGITEVTSFVGKGATRFMLVYSPEQPNSSYGQFVVRVDDYKKIPELEKKVFTYLQQNYPDSEPVIKLVRLGPGRDFKVEVRFSGPDPAVLRRLSQEAQKIMVNDGGLISIRDNWRHREKLVTPVYSQTKARGVGVSREQFSQALEEAFRGLQVGFYREGDELIPIVARRPANERLNVASIRDLQIWSPTLNRTVPIGQVTSAIQVKSEDTLIRRRDRLRTITVQANPGSDLANEVFKRIRPKIDAIKLPPGYSRAWGGEYEDSRDAQAALFGILPFGFLAMILVVIFLFGKARQPAIIWLCVPLAVIGVTAGLLITGQSFGFMALLGFLSLSGMLIKNAVVLIDQIDLEITEGKDPLRAVIDSSVSRVRPVCMAAFTTILGMIPLLADAFFVSMAVTIMAGLAFATILTLIFVPVMYAIFFKIPFRATA